MDRSEIRRWVAVVALALPWTQLGYADDARSNESLGSPSEQRSQGQENAERAPGAGAGAPTTAGPDHASEVELNERSRDDDNDAPEPAGIGGGETHGHRDYGGSRDASTSPYDVPGANPSDIYN